jgi:hypothetical protein
LLVWLASGTEAFESAREFVRLLRLRMKHAHSPPEAGHRMGRGLGLAINPAIIEVHQALERPLG